MIWLLLFLGAIFPLAVSGVIRARPEITRDKPLRMNLCKACGYDRHGLKSAASCPECGNDPAAALNRLRLSDLVHDFTPYLPLLGFLPTPIVLLARGSTAPFGIMVLGIVCAAHVVLVRVIREHLSSVEFHAMVLLPLAANIGTQIVVYTRTLLEPYDGYNHWTMFASTPMIAGSVTGWVFAITGFVIVTIRR